MLLIEFLYQGIPFLSYNVGESVKIIRKYLPHSVQDSFDKKEGLANLRPLSYLLIFSSSFLNHPF